MRFLRSETSLVQTVGRAARNSEARVIFGGRLAEYRYYDMDDVIEKAMRDAEKRI